MFSGYVHHWGKIPGLQILGPKKGHGPNLGISEKTLQSLRLGPHRKEAPNLGFLTSFCCKTLKPFNFAEIWPYFDVFVGLFSPLQLVLTVKRRWKTKSKMKFSWLQTHGFPPWRLGGSSSRAAFWRDKSSDMKSKLMDWWWDWIMFGGMIMIMMIMMGLWLWWDDYDDYDSIGIG